MATGTNQEEDDGETSDGPAIKMCPELKAFYDHHGILGAEQILRAQGNPSTRFVRLNPRHDKAETLSLLKVRLLCLF